MEKKPIARILPKKVLDIRETYRTRQVVEQKPEPKIEFGINDTYAGVNDKYRRETIF